MSQRFGPITVALTGQFPLVLVVSALLALVVSVFLLRRYRRAVIRSMRRRSRSEILELKGFLPAEPEHKPPKAPLSFSFVTRDSENSKSRGAAKQLYNDAMRGPWLGALVYGIAGCGFAAAMSAAFLLSSRMEFSPLRFLFLTWVNGWPIVFTTYCAAAVSRRAKLIVALAYLALGISLGALLLTRSPDTTAGRLAVLWVSANIPSSILLLIFLHRRIRAVGPLVLLFMITGVTGAIVIVQLVEKNPKLLGAIRDFSISIGIGPIGAVLALYLIGFITFAVLGWFVVGSIRALYQRKQISEQSVLIDTIWLVFGIVNAVGLAVQGPWWILSGPAAFVLFKLLVIAGFRALGRKRAAERSGPRLLLLRVFALGERSEKLCDSLGKTWRAVGSIQMIAGPDLATSAIAPHEFLDFLGGKLARRFIDSGRTLDVRVDQMELAPDREGQYRVTEFFCHDDTWKLTLARLADESDALLMDLSGFSQKNPGCVSEINELFNLVPLRRLVFAVDETTDQPFLRQTMQHAWAQLKDRSPNHRLP
ncbi:MAG: hypothetical protein ACREPG_06000, partial [Candidatus Binatia bacterium]